METKEEREKMKVSRQRIIAEDEKRKLCRYTVLSLCAYLTDGINYLPKKEWLIPTLIYEIRKITKDFSEELIQKNVQSWWDKETGNLEGKT